MSILSGDFNNLMLGDGVKIDVNEKEVRNLSDYHRTRPGMITCPECDYYWLESNSKIVECPECKKTFISCPRCKKSILKLVDQVSKRSINLVKEDYDGEKLISQEVVVKNVNERFKDMIKEMWELSYEKNKKEGDLIQKFYYSEEI